METSEKGTPTFYDRVRKALGKHNPDGDASHDEICAVIERLVWCADSLPTPNNRPVPEPTQQ